MSKLPPPAPTVSAEGPCPTIIQVSRTPRHWKFTQYHHTTPPPPSMYRSRYPRLLEILRSTILPQTLIKPIRSTRGFLKVRRKLESLTYDADNSYACSACGMCLSSSSDGFTIYLSLSPRLFKSYFFVSEGGGWR